MRNRDEGYKRVSADVLFPDDKAKDAPTETDESIGPGKTTMLYRQVRMNKDIALLALVVAICAYIGFSVRGLEVSLEGFLKIVLEIVAAIIAITFKLLSKQGKLAKELEVRSKQTSNIDIVLFALLIFFVTFLGWKVRGMTLSVANVIELSIEASLAILVCLGYLYLKPGPIKAKLSSKFSNMLSRANKSEDELDAWGRTIDPTYKRKK